MAMPPTERSKLPAVLRIRDMTQWVKLTQINGNAGLPIYIKKAAIIHISPRTLDASEGTFVMAQGDTRPIAVAESYGAIASALGWHEKTVVTVTEPKEEE